ncbi:MAG: hypothetical protein RL508_797 [Actinomycetota bacterium]
MIAKSMSHSWHNFFFGALDPAGLIGLDKIPGSYWIPALMVKWFGFHNRAVVAPNGVATILAVIVIAYAARRLGGIWVGLITGLLVASTPIVIAVARSNQPESFFVLSMAIATYCMISAIQTQRRWHLVLAGLAIALAFQSYMIVAWAVWPALALAWLFTSRPLRTKLIDLAIAGAASLLASTLWIIVVWLVPANRRPYIGNTLHNNPWEMVFGYNALGRFGSASKMTGVDKTALASFKTFTPPFAGHPGVLRLFYHQNIGQMSWLLLAALVALVYLWLKGRHRTHLILLGTWLIIDWAMFSAVAGMHQFYTATMAFPMALLVATAVYETIHNRHRIWLSAIVLTASVFTFVVLAGNPGYQRHLPYIQVAIAAIAIALIWFAKAGRLSKTFIGATTALAICCTPLIWSIDAQRHPSFVNPMAGPPDSYTTKLGHHSKFSEANASDTKPAVSHGKIIKYLEANAHGAKFLVAAFGADAAAAYVLQSNQNVIPIGGFSGADPVPSLLRFKQLVHSGQVNYVLMNHFKGDAKGLSGWQSVQIKRWVKLSCHKDYHAPMGVTLYSCLGVR